MYLYDGKLSAVIIGGEEGGIRTSADPYLMQQLLKLDRSSQAFCMSPAPTDQCGKTTLKVLKITFEL